MKRLVLLLTFLALTGTTAGAPDPPQGVRYLSLIRHGIYDRDEKADDRVGNGLNALGKEQARLIGARLAKLPVKANSLVSSDLTRARETAREIGRTLHMTPAVDPLLSECIAASERADLMEKTPAAEIQACDSQLAEAWARYARPSPEADARDVLACHGNVIRWFVCRALGVDTRRWTTMDIANGSLTVIAIRPDGSTRLVTFSDVGHLPVAKQTWSGRGGGWGSAPGR